MSLDAATRFFAKAKETNTLRTTVGNALATIGRSKGYDFTAEEAAAVLARMPVPSDELSHTELDRVAGGGSPMGFHPVVNDGKHGPHNP
jgi:predicted ribosomally synthesized peptide with nif11-like leader